MVSEEWKLIISGIFPFNKLKRKEMDTLLFLCEVRKYNNGQILYHQADPPDYFYILLQGRLLILTEQTEGEVEIELLKRGTCFGMISLFTDEPHSVTVRSIEEALVLRVEKEKFKDFLNKHPLLYRDFSRILSQRVKSRLKPKRIFQSKRIVVYGFPSVGKTTYMYNLGRSLRKQTSKKVICVEIRAQGDFALQGLINEEAAVLSLSQCREEEIEKHIFRGEVDSLLVRTDAPGNAAALLNFLSESYHFILYEFPFWEKHFEEFIFSAHYLHFLLRPKKEELKRAGAFIRILKRREFFSQENIKVIISEFIDGDALSFEAKSKIINQPIYATLSSYNDEQYYKTLRRVSRQLGEVVLGLALGSGAAYGFSHIGVLKVLEENDIPVDVICGSSMGAIVAALWAMGKSISDIERAMRKFGKQFSSLSFSGLFGPFRGILKARSLSRILKDMFGEATFADLKHPLKLVAFDFFRRETKILQEGSLYKVIAASCAVPGIFEPVKFKGDILLDGGILNPLPTKILLNSGAHKVIAVNITPSKEEIFKEYKGRNKFHIFDFIFGSIETMQLEFVKRAMSISDVVIHPNMEGIGWTEFDKVDEFIKRGALAAQEKLEEIKCLVAP